VRHLALAEQRELQEQGLRGSQHQHRLQLEEHGPQERGLQAIQEYPTEQTQQCDTACKASHRHPQKHTLTIDIIHHES